MRAHTHTRMPPTWAGAEDAAPIEVKKEEGVGVAKHKEGHAYNNDHFQNCLKNLGRQFNCTLKDYSKYKYDLPK